VITVENVQKIIKDPERLGSENGEGEDTWRCVGNRREKWLKGVRNVAGSSNKNNKTCQAIKMSSFLVKGNAQGL